MRAFLALLVACCACAAGINFSYDSAGRLIKVDYGNGSVISYIYDNAGNMTSRTEQTSGGGPQITSVNTTSGGSDIAQDTWIEIKGSGLVPSTTPAAGAIWSTAPSFANGQLPTQLGSISVTVNGKAAYIYYYCSAVTSAACAKDQINVLTPLDSTVGPVAIVVTNGSVSSAPFTANLKSVAPTFLLFTAQGYVASTHTDFSLVGPTTLYPGSSTPAKPGETIVTYAVGFGLPGASISSGSSTQTGTLPTVPVCQLGGNPAPVSFAGLISPGLYQINLVLPAAAVDGDNSLVCTYGGSSTPTGALITVQK